MAYRCAILDDYQNVALKLADWSKITKDVDIKVFTEAVRRSDADTISELKDFLATLFLRRYVTYCAGDAATRRCEAQPNYIGRFLRHLCHGFGTMWVKRRKNATPD